MSGLILPPSHQKKDTKEPDFFVTISKREVPDLRARKRWVDEQRKEAERRGCKYASAATAACKDGDLLVVAGWKKDPSWLY